ncbi:MAG: hypothetical protein GX685_08770 [Clostridiales bacterium]|nr:hypothetical protein [Clostridiales bacterium]
MVEEDDENGVGIKITSEGGIEEGTGDQSGIKLTSEDQEDGEDLERPEYGATGKDNCILHWILLLLAIAMFIITLIKRSDNKKEYDDEMDEIQNRRTGVE